MSGLPDFKNIKAMVGMADILNRYGLMPGFKTKKPEGEQLSGRCPIHKGTRPDQFSVNVKKNCWQCFGDCKTGGNILDFVAAMEKVNIKEAGLMLSNWFNVPLKNNQTEGKVFQNSKSQTADSASLVREEKERAAGGDKRTASGGSAAVNPPLTFSLKNLDAEHPYLKERGLLPETIKHFGFGYCNKGLMAGRIAIPIHNENGELVAYAGRWPGGPPEGEPKYKMPAGFHKSSIVFNLHRAKESAKEKGLILVEGFFDCVKVWQAGFTNVVSLMGSSMGQEQEKLVLGAVDASKKVVLMFDEDDAGQACRNDVLIRLVSSVYVRIVNLPEENQPDKLSTDVIKEMLGKL